MIQVAVGITLAADKLQLYLTTITDVTLTGDNTPHNNFDSRQLRALFQDAGSTLTSENLMVVNR